MKNVCGSCFGRPPRPRARPYVAPVRCARHSSPSAAAAAFSPLLSPARADLRRRARAQVELADGAAHVDDRKRVGTAGGTGRADRRRRRASSSARAAQRDAGGPGAVGQVDEAGRDARPGVGLEERWRSFLAGVDVFRVNFSTAARGEGGGHRTHRALEAAQPPDRDPRRPAGPQAPRLDLRERRGRPEKGAIFRSTRRRAGRRDAPSCAPGDHLGVAPATRC